MAINKVVYGSDTLIDITDTTATAEDVAQGKYFYSAAGVKTLGTAEIGGIEVIETPDSHGGTIVEINGTTGGGGAKEFIMRPDAELVHSWSADELIVEDLELTLPAYATSAKTIRAGAALSPTITIDRDNYNYYVIMRGLSIPIYNTETKVKGRCEYGASSYLYEFVHIPANEIKTLDGSKAITSLGMTVTANGSVGRELYWSSATAITVAANVTYGAYVTGVAPTISGTTMTVKYPTYGIRGNTNQMSSGAWENMTDIREQYVVEVWRAKKGTVDGWGLTTDIRSILADVRNGGDLT